MRKKNTTNNEVVEKTLPVVDPVEDKLEIIALKYHYANMVRELFKRDPEIKMEFDEVKCIIDMEVDNEIKALAIRRLLPEKKELVDGSSVTINVNLRHDRFGGPTFLKDTVYEAFKGNPLFDYQYWWTNPEVTTNPYCWVVLSPEAIFYPESNLHNIYGDTVDLPETIAQSILGDATDLIYYCSKHPEKDMPDHSARKFNKSEQTENK